MHDQDKTKQQLIDELANLRRQIAERKDLESSFKVPEGEYRSLVTNIPAVVWKTDSAGRTFYISPNVKDVYGYAPEEIYAGGESLWFGRIHPDDAEKVKQEFHQAFTDKKPLDVEYRIRRKDGEWIWLHDRSVGAYEKGGEEYINGFFVDITTRVNAEKALRESEYRMRTLLENSPDNILIVDKDYKIRFINQFGTGDSEAKGIIGVSVFEYIMKAFHKDYEQALKRTFKTGEIQSLDVVGANNRWYNARFIALRDVDREVVRVMVIATDVTERRKAEEQLHQERDKAQHYFNVAEVMMMVIERNGNVLMINGRGCKILGYDEKEVIGKNWFDNFLPEGLRREIKKVHQQVVEGCLESTEYYENPILTKSGEERLIAWHNANLRDQEGNIIGSISSGEDITDRRKVALALRASEEKYRSLFESASEALFIMDITEGDRYCFLDCNERTLKLFGCTHRGQLIGKGPEDFSPPIQPDGKSSHEKAHKLNKAAMEGNAQCFEWKHHHLDGTPFWVEVTLNRIEIKHHFYMQAIVRDISERKQAEQKLEESEKKYRLLFETSAMPVTVWDIQLRLKMLNGLSVRNLGVKTKEDVIDKSMRDIFPDLFDITQKRFKIICKTGKGLEFEDNIKFPDGRMRWFWSNMQPIKNIHGEVVAIQIISRETTEHKQAEQKIEESEKKYRTLFNAATDAILTIKMDGKDDKIQFVDCNPGAVKMFGCSSPDELIGKSPEDFSPSIQPDGFSSRKRTIELIKAAMSGEPQSFEWVHYRLSGKPFIAEVNLNYVDLIGQKRIQAIIRDGTERKKAEDLIRTYNLELEKQKKALEDKNIALREVISQIESEKNKIKDDIASNVDQMLLPTLKKIRIKGVSSKYLLLLENRLKELTSEFGRKITEKSMKLTGKEIEICDMIRGGLTSKDVASLLNISHETVGKHRKNIRKKLRISNKDINLTSFLQRL